MDDPSPVVAPETHDDDLVDSRLDNNGYLHIGVHGRAWDHWKLYIRCTEAEARHLRNDCIALCQRLKDYRGQRVQGIVWESVTRAIHEDHLKEYSILVENVAYFLRHHHFSNVSQPFLRIYYSKVDTIDKLVDALCDNIHVSDIRISTNTMPSPRVIHRLSAKLSTVAEEPETDDFVDSRLDSNGYLQINFGLLVQPNCDNEWFETRYNCLTLCRCLKDYRGQLVRGIVFKSRWGDPPDYLKEEYSLLVEYVAFFLRHHHFSNVSKPFLCIHGSNVKMIAKLVDALCDNVHVSDIRFSTDERPSPRVIHRLSAKLFPVVPETDGFVDSRLDSDGYLEINFKFLLDYRCDNQWFESRYNFITLCRCLKDYQGQLVRGIILPRFLHPNYVKEEYVLLLENVAFFLRHHHFSNVSCPYLRIGSSRWVEQSDKLVDALCDNIHVSDIRILVSPMPSPRVIDRLSAKLFPVVTVPETDGFVDSRLDSDGYLRINFDFLLGSHCDNQWIEARYNCVTLCRRLKAYQGHRVRGIIVQGYPWPRFDAPGFGSSHSVYVKEEHSLLLENVAYFLRHHHFSNVSQPFLRIHRYNVETTDKLLDALCDNVHVSDIRILFLTAKMPSPRVIHRLSAKLFPVVTVPETDGFVDSRLDSDGYLRINFDFLLGSHCDNQWIESRYNCVTLCRRLKAYQGHRVRGIIVQGSRGPRFGAPGFGSSHSVYVKEEHSLLLENVAYFLRHHHFSNVSQPFLRIHRYNVKMIAKLVDALCDNVHVSDIRFSTDERPSPRVIDRLSAKLFPVVTVPETDGFVDSRLGSDGYLRINFDFLLGSETSSHCDNQWIETRYNCVTLCRRLKDYRGHRVRGIIVRGLPRPRFGSHSADVKEEFSLLLENVAYFLQHHHFSNVAQPFLCIHRYKNVETMYNLEYALCDNMHVSAVRIVTGTPLFMQSLPSSPRVFHCLIRKQSSPRRSDAGLWEDDFTRNWGVYRIEFETESFSCGEHHLIDRKFLLPDFPFYEVTLRDCRLTSDAVNCLSRRSIKALRLQGRVPDCPANLFKDFVAPLYEKQSFLCELHVNRTMLAAVEMRSLCLLLERPDCHIITLRIDGHEGRTFEKHAQNECISIFFDRLANMPSLWYLEFHCHVTCEQVVRTIVTGIQSNTILRKLQGLKVSQEIDFWQRCINRGRYMVKNHLENPNDTPPALGVLSKVLYHCLSCSGRDLDVSFFFLRQIAPSLVTRLDSQEQARPN